MTVTIDSEIVRWISYFAAGGALLATMLSFIIWARTHTWTSRHQATCFAFTIFFLQIIMAAEMLRDRTPSEIYVNFTLLVALLLLSALGLSRAWPLRRR
jgi:hypothetical protein